MSTMKRLTGSDAKTRRGTGWGGKGSVHPTADRFVDAFGKKVPCRYRRAYRNKPHRPHQGEREKLRRRAGGMRYAEQRLFFDALPSAEAAQ